MTLRKGRPNPVDDLPPGFQFGDGRWTCQACGASGHTYCAVLTVAELGDGSLNPLDFPILETIRTEPQWRPFNENAAARLAWNTLEGEE